MLANSKQSAFTVKDVPAASFIKAYAEQLKTHNRTQLPQWIDYVKTSTAKDLAPEDPDWIFTRIASVARKVYLRAHIGVGALRHLYGSNKRNGVQRRHHHEACGKIIRYSLHYLENLGVLSKDKKSAEKKFSRVVTPNGRKEMDVVANTIAKTIYPREK